MQQQDKGQMISQRVVTYFQYESKERMKIKCQFKMLSNRESSQREVMGFSVYLDIMSLNHRHLTPNLGFNGKYCRRLITVDRRDDKVRKFGNSNWNKEKGRSFIDLAIK